jgi:hypothetical protein
MVALTLCTRIVPPPAQAVLTSTPTGPSITE